jgi:serine protease Do
VFIDGKPIDVYVNEDVSVKLRDVNRYKLSPDASQFRFKSGDWDMGGDMDGGPEKPFLGVMTEGTTQGARIEKLSENGAATKAGLKEGDVITKVNGKNVFDHEQLSDVISQLKPEEKVTITYKRDGKENKTTATLGKRKASLSRAFHYAPNDLGPMPPLAFDFDGYNPGDLGNLLELRNRPRLGIKAQDTEDGSGVKILGVDEDSPADKAGVKENDIITSFDGKKVTNADELAKASRESKDKASIKIDVNRNGKAQTLEVKVPKKLKTANL